MELKKTVFLLFLITETEHTEIPSKIHAKVNVDILFMVLTRFVRIRCVVADIHASTFGVPSKLTKQIKCPIEAWLCSKVSQET